MCGQCFPQEYENTHVKIQGELVLPVGPVGSPWFSLLVLPVYVELRMKTTTPSDVGGIAYFMFDFLFVSSPVVLDTRSFPSTHSDVGGIANESSNTIGCWWNCVFYVRFLVFMSRPQVDYVLLCVILRLDVVCRAGVVLCCWCGWRPANHVWRCCPTKASLQVGSRPR